MIRALGSSACLAIALAMPMQEAAAQDPVGGAIVGGATGAIIGGVLGGGRGAAIGAIIGGATGAAIGAEGELRPGGYRYFQDACYQQQPDGAWLAVLPELWARTGLCSRQHRLSCRYRAATIAGLRSAADTGTRLYVDARLLGLG